MTLGERGPAGKRSEQRLGHPTRSAAESTTAQSARDVVVQPPAPADEQWHPVARQWYESLGRSGQAIYYTESDWMTAYMLAESISRDLNPRFVGTSGQTGEEIVRAMPISGSSLSSYLKGFTDLLVTEASRRRVSVELQRGDGEPDEAEQSARGKVTNARARFEKQTG